MARKKYEEMSKEELEVLIKWMDDKIRYMRFLLTDKFSK